MKNMHRSCRTCQSSREKFIIEAMPLFDRHRRVDHMERTGRES
jgi:hypothetical protein